MIYFDFVNVLLPSVFFTVKLTAYVPFFVYLCEGVLTVEMLLSPNFHDQLVRLLVLLSVNFTVSGAFPDLEKQRRQLLAFVV